MTRMPFVVGPQSAVEADPGHTEFGSSFLPLDAAVEPAFQARKSLISPWTVEALQSHWACQP
jgi:hypothetical protein